jgi:hypothetical protein
MFVADASADMLTAWSLIVGPILACGLMYFQKIETTAADVA